MAPDVQAGAAVIRGVYFLQGHTLRMLVLPSGTTVVVELPDAADPAYVARALRSAADSVELAGDCAPERPRCDRMDGSIYGSCSRGADHVGACDASAPVVKP